MADETAPTEEPTTPDPAPAPRTRAQRLADQQAAYLDWARTADSDEPPPELGATT